ncbi:hypothetical protein CARUB_v10028279mg [Capsella rubella]|uniref:PUM-HD domain-containing protein n=1 Tax=Capsella rubella TaxID=81985 RepID=R0F0Z5_9BRAS|nr:putative pumilio homolog 16 [Capsella rubella]EOA14936.1 hypothetical protein CARUB_v10028279mg [Capsella rubella]
METTNPFSMTSMFDALQELRFAPARQTTNEEPPVMIPPPPPREEGDSLFCWGIRADLIPDISEMISFQWIFDLMTISEGDGRRFKDVISTFDMSKLEKIVSMLTSDSDYFMEVARNKFGSKNMQRLMGKSDYMDTFFYKAITRIFVQVMTDKYASYVGIQGTRVFQQDKKELIYEFTLRHALHLACDQHGCIALNEIITDLDHRDYRNQLLDIVANNAVWLSNDPYGNFVVQHVLELRDMRCTRNIAVNLRGHYVDLSFRKYGSYIVDKVLKAGGSVMEDVVLVLVKCKGEKLMRLARSEYGNFVIRNALLLTMNYMTPDLFYALVNKLMPFRHLLSRSPGRYIATILDSILYHPSSFFPS